jgi:dolichol-phosphate mannosyltransferase
LPCYNEERNVQPLISEINRAISQSILYRIIAVNDGSEDDTANVLRRLLKEYPIQVIDHKKNFGLAAALRTGLNAALEHASEDDFIVTMDADNTHDPTTIKYMIKEMEEGAEIVVGSRYTKGGKQLNVPPHRILLSKICNFIISKILHIPLKDVTSNFRCYRASTLKKVAIKLGDKFIQSNGFDAPLEILFKTYLYAHAIVKEVPTTLHYGRKLGGSKLKLIQTIVNYLRLFHRLRNLQKRIQF